MEELSQTTQIEMRTRDGRILSNREVYIRLWRKNNPERVRGYTRVYDEKHREKKREKNLSKVTCDCGAVVSYVNFACHKRSLKHQQWQEQQPHV